MADERWLEVKDIVDKLSVHPNTVRRWLKSGQLLGRNFGGRTGYRIRESDLNAFLAIPGANEAPAEEQAPKKAA
jgi:excisionase family DNA binding protein